MQYQPHAYQDQAIKFLLGQACGGLFLDPGLGKTSITYATFKVLLESGMAERMLVIAPLRPAESTWPREAQKWDEFRGLNVHVLHGKDKQMLLEQPHHVSVINPEGLGWLFKEAKRLRIKWDMLVVDESTRFKHTNTQRFKALRPHLHEFNRRVILTGSPAPNGLMDLFGQVYLLDQGNALGSYITHFRNAYFDATGYGGYTWVPKEDAAERIYARLRPLVLRMRGEDYLKLPPLINNTVEVELPPEARKAYDQMEKLLLAQVEEGIVTAANVGAATIKCRQIANGGLYGSDPKVRTLHHLHEAKTEAVQELVEELSGKPALIAYEFQHDLERLQRAFPGAPYLGGGVTAKKAREVEDAWNAGGLPVLLAQPQSVAHGLNLQGVGAAVIWHSLTWDLENYEQLIRRIWRQGQRERVVVHHVVARGTVDEVVMRGVAKKDRTQRALLEALRERAAGSKRPRSRAR
jgi:SNF2 family DNA or RNA helicase